MNQINKVQMNQINKVNSFHDQDVLSGNLRFLVEHLSLLLKLVFSFLFFFFFYYEKVCVSLTHFY